VYEKLESFVLARREAFWKAGEGQEAIGGFAVHSAIEGNWGPYY